MPTTPKDTIDIDREALRLLIRHGYLTRKAGTLHAAEELMFSLVQPQRLATGPEHLPAQR